MEIKRCPYRVHFQTNHLSPELELLRMRIERVDETDVKASVMNIPGVGAPKNRPPEGAGAVS